MILRNTLAQYSTLGLEKNNLKKLNMFYPFDFVGTWT